MKTKNQREMQKYWSDKASKAAKPNSAAKKQARENVDRSASRTEGEAKKD